MSSVARKVSTDYDRQLEQENAGLRATVAALRHDVADLRATAALWQKLYEDAIRRCAERDGEKL